MKGYRVAIVGATGLVGQEFIKTLEQRNFPMESISLLASDRSAGKKLFVNHHEIEVKETTPESFKGIDIEFRPIKPTDDSALREFFYRLPKDSLYRRFFSIPKAIPHEKREELAFIDYDQIFSMVGIVRDENGNKQIVAEGRYMVDPDTDSAEWAITIHENFQGFGIGSYLLSMLSMIARSRGIKKFWAEILQSNRRALHLASNIAYRHGWEFESILEEGTYLIVFNMNKSSTHL